MKTIVPVLILLVTGVTTLHAKSKSPRTPPAPAPDPAAEEKIIREQIFLDTANFGPGQIDGRGGEFTTKARALYQKAHQPKEGDPSGLPLDSVKEAFTEYTVTGEDMKNVGRFGHTPPEQSKLKHLPYSSVLELIAEKFHTSGSYIVKLNPKRKMEALKSGDQVRVPNAPPFEIGEVQAQKAELEKAAESQAKENKHPSAEAAGPSQRTIRVDVAAKMLELYESDKLLAAFPITPGSQSLPAPKGTWMIKSITYLPPFRYDKSMLMKGKRSNNAFVLPPGPRNPVGIIWIGLNKTGIGIHGTNTPETIGRSASHGCIRLANWDAFKLGPMVSPGIKVTIE